MKPRKKGMKYKSPKKRINKAIFAIGGGGAVVIIALFVLLLPKTKNDSSKETTNKNLKHQVTCDFYYNENGDDIWIPSQEFHYTFIFSEKEDKIEKIHLSEKSKYNTGSQEERKVYINGNTYSIIPGGSDEEIKNQYYSGCDSCSVSEGIMSSESDMTLEEFMQYSNLRNDNKKTLMNNLMDTFNNTQSCEEGFYPYIPYVDTQAEYCPIENFRSSCTVKDVK